MKLYIKKNRQLRACACGKEFTPGQYNPKQKFCSKSCYTKARNKMLANRKRDGCPRRERLDWSSRPVVDAVCTITRQRSAIPTCNL